MWPKRQRTRTLRLRLHSASSARSIGDDALCSPWCALCCFCRVTSSWSANTVATYCDRRCGSTLHSGCSVGARLLHNEELQFTQRRRRCAKLPLQSLTRQHAVVLCACIASVRPRKGNGTASEEHVLLMKHQLGVCRNAKAVCDKATAYAQLTPLTPSSRFALHPRPQERGPCRPFVAGACTMYPKPTRCHRTVSVGATHYHGYRHGQRRTT